MTAMRVRLDASYMRVICRLSVVTGTRDLAVSSVVLIVGVRAMYGCRGCTGWGDGADCIG